MSDIVKIDLNKVICPHCTHQFRAIPLTVQYEQREAAAEIERLRAALELAQNLDDPLLLEIERLRAENRRLVALVEDAFEEGFQEGKDGGWICGATIPWSKSYARAALEGK